jgi:hypothetical protein
LPCQGEPIVVSERRATGIAARLRRAGFHVRTGRPRAAIARLMEGWPDCGPAFQSRGPPVARKGYLHTTAPPGTASRQECRSCRREGRKRRHALVCAAVLAISFHSRSSLNRKWDEGSLLAARTHADHTSHQPPATSRRHHPRRRSGVKAKRQRACGDEGL